MQEARKFVYVACKNEVNPKIKGVLPENRVCLLDVEPKDTTKPKSRRKDLLLATSKEKTQGCFPKQCLPQQYKWEGFPGGWVVKNPGANARDMGSIPDLGRSHMPWATTTEPVLGSPEASTTEAHVFQLLEPRCPRACAPQREELPQWETLTQQLVGRPRSPQLEKCLPINKDPAQPTTNF